MKKALHYLTLICLMVPAIQLKAQDIQNTLLWRISGKGMAHPSYLFGTIHLQDRRVFNLPDSLYAAMDNTEVFSLEVNADSINSDLSAYYTKMFDDMDKPEDKKLKNVLDKKELDELQKKVGGDNDIKAGDLTVKQAYLLKEKLVKPGRKEDDMPTFLDAWLYKIAKDKGKQIAGLERLEDQMALLENISDDDIDVHEVFKNLKKEKTAMEGLVQRYLAADLKSIQEWYRMLPAEVEDKMLIRRNRKMVRSMDSIMRNHSLFAAVGTAHLPGKAGLIQLLRNEGYTVEPVFSSTYTHAATYKFKGGTSSWVNVVVDEDGYSVRMPGVPSQVDAADGLVKMKIFVDLATSEVYYTCHVAIAMDPGPEMRDSIMDAWANATIVKLRTGPLKTKRITTNGVEGKQYAFAGSDKNNYRVEILGKNKDMYLLMSSNKNSKSSNADSFHNSFRLVGKTGGAWTRQDFEDEYISVRMPGKAKKKVTYDEDSTMMQVNYTSADAATGAYYYVSVNKTTAGYTYTDDSLMIRDIQKRMKKKGGTFTAKELKTAGYTACEYRFISPKGRLLAGRIILRGNRIYNIAGETENNTAGNADVDNFLGSISLLPFSQPVYSTATSPDGVFKTTAPAAFTVLTDDADDTTAQEKNTHTVHYVSFDRQRLISYDVVAERMSPYYWSTSDTAVVRRWINGSREDQDSLTAIKIYRKGKLWIGDAVGIPENTTQLHRIKVIMDGRTIYIIRCKVPQFAAGDKGIDAFFNSFTILKPETESLQSSPAVFFKDLHSKDSARYNKAILHMSEVGFSKTDIPVLLDEAVKSFVGDTGNYDAAGIYLIGEIREYRNDISVSRMAQLYNDLPADKGTLKFTVLGIMASMEDSVAAFRAIKQLMLAHPPQNGLPYMLRFSLGNHPQLLKTFYPDWLQLAKDSISGGTICELAADLADSNIITVASLQSSLPALLADSKSIREQAGSYFQQGILDLLAVFNNNDTWNEIAQYQFAQGNLLKYRAVSLLLQHGKTPEPRILDTLAGDREYRTSLYNVLKEKERTNLFPKRFLEQRYFAESHLYEYSEEEGFDYFSFIGERTTIYKGKICRFFLYEMKYDSKDEESYLGVAGPYNARLASVDVDEENDATGWDNLPDKKDVNKVFKAYLIQQEAPPPYKELTGTDD